MGTLTIDLADLPDLSNIARELRQRSAAMLPCPASFSHRGLESVELRLELSGEQVCCEVGRVVHVAADGRSVAVTFGPDVAAALADHMDRAAQSAGDDTAPDTNDEAAKPEDEKGRSTAKWKTYETLSKAEKIRMARHGSAADRKLILRDRDSSLHPMILNNPRLKAQELVGLITSGYAGIPFINKVCERREWTSKGSVALALVNCPKTPIQVAVQLVGRLQMPVIRKIAKEQKLRTQIITAARRRMR